jgi:hypothetical protein
MFVLTLGYRRKSVRLLTFQSSAQTWAELHEQAFRRLGGAPRIVVLDNLREGVLKPDIYDPALNPVYRDLLAHDGAVALPCRVGDPDRKGKVERAVGHATNTPLKVSTVALLIIDDFGMRRLPPAAAEDLLEIIMRRYERASTLLTSNRPVEDWGKLLGDVAAVSAMLDRLLHHGQVLKCGPRSWRTKTAAAD